MANTLPLNIPIPQSAAIASYSYTDIAEGTGVQVFYGACARQDGTKKYYLTSSTPSSSDIVTSGASALTANTWVNVLDVDFDVTFNRPQNIKGNTYLNLTYGSTQGGSGTGSITIKVSGASLIHYDGTTETVLVVASGAQYTHSDAAGTYSYTDLIKLPVTTTRHFKANETLRLSINLWALDNAAPDVLAPGFAHDPQDRNAPSSIKDADTTKLTLYVPFLNNKI